MKTVNLSIEEIISILDPLNQSAYDKLQSALEEKVSKDIGEDQWLKVWNSDDWTINLTLNYLEAE